MVALISNPSPYASGSPTVTLVGGGIVIAIVTGTGGDGGGITAATLGGVSGTLFATENGDAGAEEAVSSVFTWPDQGAGNKAVTTSVDSGVGSVSVEIYEFDAGALRDFTRSTYGASTSPMTLTNSVSGQVGETVVTYAIISDNASHTTSSTTTDNNGNLESFTPFVNNKLIGASGYDLSVSSTPETYSITFQPDEGVGGGTIDRGVIASFVVYALPNVDPVLDTPQSDVTIQEGQTGTINAGANFSDANAGDTLTFNDDLNIGAETGFGFNTLTGVITYEGTQVEGVYPVEITASDGNGGTYPTDSFTITVIPPALSIDSIDDANPTVGDQITVGHSNALDTLTTPDFTISSQDGTEAVIDIPDITSLVLTGETYPTINFDEAVTITLSDGTNTADVELTGIQKPAGTLFAEITENNPNGRYGLTPAIVAGMFGYFYDIVGNWIIDPATGLTAVDSSGGSLKYKVYNGEWSAEATYAVASETVAPEITLRGESTLIWVQGTPWVDPQADVTDNIDPTRQINADSAPNVNNAGTYVLSYNATDAAGNVATTVNRTVIVTSGDNTPNQFTFTDIANAELSTEYESIREIVGVDIGQTLTVTNGLLSNDGGSTWSSSVQMVASQTRVKATLTSSATNSTQNSVVVTVNGVSDTFSVTTKAAVTRTFSIANENTIVNGQGATVTYLFPIWELWTAVPEEGGTVVDQGTNANVNLGTGTISSSVAELSTDYLLILRDSGNTPANYVRIWGQVT